MIRRKLMLQNMKFMVLKPYKGNGVVLMNKIDYDEEAMVLWQNEI